MASFFILMSAWTAWRVTLNERPEAVVIVQMAEIRSGPNDSYPASFTVPEGRRLLILEAQEAVQGWLEVGVPQEGLKGWIEQKSIEPV